MAGDVRNRNAQRATLRNRTSASRSTLGLYYKTQLKAGLSGLFNYGTLLAYSLGNTPSRARDAHHRSPP